MSNRTTPILVIAICHFVFGGLGLFCSVCGGVMSATGLGVEMAKAFVPNPEQQAERTKENERTLVARVPGYRFYKSFEGAMDLILSGAMVAAGFGLLYMKSWGHWLSTGYAFASILVGIIFVFYHLSYLGP